MSSLLAPISQMTRGQHVFGACLIVHGLSSVVSAGVNAYNASDRDIRMKYIALVCLETLNTAFKSITFLGYATGNVTLVAMGASLTLIFFKIIGDVELTIKTKEMNLIDEGRFIYRDIRDSLENDNGNETNIFNNDEKFNQFTYTLNVNYQIDIPTNSKDKLKTLFEKFFEQIVEFALLSPNTFNLSSPSWNQAFLSFYNDIKALEVKHPG